jgi:hypothetical protein
MLLAKGSVYQLVHSFHKHILGHQIGLCTLKGLKTGLCILSGWSSVSELQIFTSFYNIFERSTGEIKCSTVYWPQNLSIVGVQCE